MEKEVENVRLIPRKCGGWLAVSHRWADIRIGVAGESEAEARENFAAAVAQWRRLLSGRAEKVPSPA